MGWTLEGELLRVGEVEELKDVVLGRESCGNIVFLLHFQELVHARGVRPYCASLLADVLGDSLKHHRQLHPRQAHCSSGGDAQRGALYRDAAHLDFGLCDKPASVSLHLAPDHKCQLVVEVAHAQAHPDRALPPEDLVRGEEGVLPLGLPLRDEIQLAGVPLLLPGLEHHGAGLEHPLVGADLFEDLHRDVVHLHCAHGGGEAEGNVGNCLGARVVLRRKHQIRRRVLLRRRPRLRPRLSAIGA
mmetsp:Transcript_7682/g.17582  ORF Transcript_7682/g.17582 Transcript_7682/m.17582 type:complete len:244 (-) Transcript_7682:3973-4704(-)